MYKIVVSVIIIGLAFFANAQTVSLIKYNQLESLIASEQNKALTVVNFWATWCGPCVKELPHFEAINNDEKVRVLLVSLDFPDEMEKVSRLVQKKKLKSDVYLLDETDYDSYMRKVSNDWSGAIPATLFVDRNNNRYFYEGAFDKQNLENTVSQIVDKL